MGNDAILVNDPFTSLNSQAARISSLGRSEKRKRTPPDVEEIAEGFVPVTLLLFVRGLFALVRQYNNLFSETGTSTIFSG